MKQNKKVSKVIKGNNDDDDDDDDDDDNVKNTGVNAL